MRLSVDLIEMKPTYEELQNRVLELEIEAENCRIAEESLRRSNDYESVSWVAGIGILKNWIPSSLRVFSSSLVLTPLILRGSAAP